MNHVSPPRKLRGIHCPDCLFPSPHVTSIYKPVAGVEIRYCRCPECNHKFSTRETLNRGPKRKFSYQ